MSLAELGQAERGQTPPGGRRPPFYSWIVMSLAELGQAECGQTPPGGRRPPLRNQDNYMRFHATGSLPACPPARLPEPTLGVGQGADSGRPGVSARDQLKADMVIILSSRPALKPPVDLA